ncbi:restriction endonuclease subunit S [Helicobacter pylori]|uniref:restriction endonuclease subunit S n=1 Tax=Helicobacter pylori TaxID=210 RepID=UPI000EACF34E|nr:restriction endonuclease subunit S [Helicobacter pylori]RKU91749.1 restriction endonuclease subunit S [Helicobacter pylori]RKU93710.1 restriction endonuclease subunit S [Helicobacter pylori]
MDALTTPSNWQRVRLGDIAEINPPTIIPNVFYYIDLESVEKGQLLNKQLMTKNKAPSRARRLLSKNDILYQLVRPYQRNNYFFTLNGNYVASTGYAQIRTLQNPSFLYFALLSNYFVNAVLDRCEGTSYPAINSNELKKCEVILPPLNEQAAIANILSDVDRYLCSLDALILKKESVKKALSFELLSQRKRLKGFNQAWQKVRLGDIGITISGLAGKTKQDFINGNAKYITFLNVLNNVIIDTSILENVKIYPNEKQNSFKKYDLFFNTSSETPKEVGMCAVLLDDIDQVFLNSFCFGFRIFDKAVDSLFLSYLINSEIGRKAFENLAQGSTRYNLSKSGFNNVCLILPPLNEQAAIANILSDLDHEIISLKNKKRQFENIKKALNHDLMSAKIRVLKQ